MATISTPLEHFEQVRRGLCAPFFLRSAQTVSDGQISRLDAKIDQTRKLYDSCDICPHDCHVNRNEGKVGYCGVANTSAVHWEGILHGEESEVIPSHEVFFSGCTMRCAFCYSHQHITRPMSGVLQSPTQLADMARARLSQGGTNWNLVGGDPTVHLLTILRTLKELAQTQTPLPVVWNSNMYIAPHAMDILDGIVDLYLGDIHFGNNDCAHKLGRIPRYFETVTRALHHAVNSGASVVIRHLLMPGHLECCARPAMEWAVNTVPQTPFHLMFQYVPDFRAKGDTVLGRPLTRDEIISAQQLAQELGVNLYQRQNPQPAPQQSDAPAQLQGDIDAIGETVDILIHEDGRVVFTRFTDELLPIATALDNQLH
jgi:putative pyruvate formate lyase activating enzyme